MSRRLANCLGATLVEVMGAVLAFTIGISALLGVFYASAGMAKRAEYAYTAYNIAKNHIENLKAFTFADLTVANETASVVDQNGVADPSGEYTRTTTATNCTNATPCTGGLIDPNLTEIDVKVWYTLRGAPSASPVEVTTILFQNG